MKIGDKVTDTKYNAIVVVTQQILDANDRLAGRWVEIPKRASQKPSEGAEAPESTPDTPEVEEDAEEPNNELETLRTEYETLAGEKPHHALKEEGLKTKIEELKNKS